jgi:hypothetical protein
MAQLVCKLLYSLHAGVSSEFRISVLFWEIRNRSY